MYTRKIAAGLMVMIFGCATLATDRVENRRAPKGVETKKTVQFTVVTKPVEFLGFLADDAEEFREVGKPTPRHVRAYRESVVDAYEPRGSRREALRSRGQELFPTDMLLEGVIVNHSDVPAVFSFPDGRELHIPSGEGVVVTTTDSNGKGISCSECVSLAVSACGQGCIASVECGGAPSGSCSFTCRPCEAK